MKSIKTFGELYAIAEAGPTPGGFTTTLGSLGKAASTVGKVLGALDPGKLASKVAAIQQQGIVGATADLFSSVGSKLTDAALNSLKKFIQKAELPAGWPKKGSKIEYVGIRTKKMEGTVTAVSLLQNKIMAVNIELSKPGSTLPADSKYAVASINTDEIQPFYSVKQWTVQMRSTDPTQGYVIDKDETGHVPALLYRPDTAIFEFNMDMRGTNPSSIPLVRYAYLDELIPPGSKIGGAVDGTDIFGKPVRGTIKEISVPLPQKTGGPDRQVATIVA